MAIYKISRKNFSHVTNDRPNNYYAEASQDLLNLPEPPKDNLMSPKKAIIGAALLSGFIALIQHFFSKKNNKYKASPDEIKAIQEELPTEYETLRKIQNEVIKSCPFVFTSRESINFYCNVLPSVLNLNGEEWIAGWARETGKKGLRWAPILSMYGSSFIFCYDFDNKYWFLIIDGKEYLPKDGNIWITLKDEFKRVSEIAQKNLLGYPLLLEQTNSYFEINTKLINKESLKLKSKSFGLIGSLFGAKNFKAMSSGIKTLKDGGTKNLTSMQRVGEAVKGAAKSGATLAGAGALGAGALAYKVGGGEELLSGGENAAKKMEFD